MNGTNTTVTVTVPIENDATLTGGTLQIQAKVTGQDFENIGSSATILEGNLGGTQSIALTDDNIEACLLYTSEAADE